MCNNKTTDEQFFVMKHLQVLKRTRTDPWVHPATGSLRVPVSLYWSEWFSPHVLVFVPECTSVQSPPLLLHPSTLKCLSAQSPEMCRTTLWNQTATKRNTTRILKDTNNNKSNLKSREEKSKGAGDLLHRKWKHMTGINTSDRQKSLHDSGSMI